MLIHTLCTGLCFVWSDMIAGPAGGCSDWCPSWTPASTLSQASSPAPHQPVDVAAPCHGCGGACYSAYQGDMLGPCQDCKKSKTTFGVVLWISQVDWRPIQYLLSSSKPRVSKRVLFWFPLQCKCFWNPAPVKLEGLPPRRPLCCPASADRLATAAATRTNIWPTASNRDADGEDDKKTIINNKKRQEIPLEPTFTYRPLTMMRIARIKWI